MTQRWRVCLVGLGVLAGLVGAVVWLDGHTNSDELVINGQALTIERADTSATRERGLSGRESLAADQGLLFVFDQDGGHGIWMKDMRFAIDVLWLDAGGRVIYLVDDMDPSSYPTTYQSPHPTRYVLELTDQAIEHLDIRQGVTTVEGL